jgi:LacI family transcriptional regulator
MVTIRDVAKKSGFSPTTVSMVLNNARLAKYIPADTKNIIRRAAKELDYKPNVFARSLRAQQTDTVGVVVFDVTDPYCTHILRGIENELNKASFLYMLSDAQNNRNRFQNNLEMLLQRRVEGLILVANSLSMNPEILESIHAPNLPITVIGREIDISSKCSSVTVNNERGGYLALQHLYNLGHREIAYLRGPKSIVDSVYRWRGIEWFAKEVGLRIPRDLVVELSAVPTTFDAGMDSVKNLLQAGRKFSAVLAFDDMTALGAIRALSEACREVPRDCSVIGFDDIDAAGFYNPPLTTIRQPMVAMGQQGASDLLSAIRGIRAKKKVSVNSHRLLEPELIVRNTTMAVPGKTRSSR